MFNRRPGGSAFCWLSLPHLVSNSSDLQLTDFLSTPNYIIVQSPTQSPTQSLGWHVWSSSSGNNCHAVHRSLSSSASVYDCTMGFFTLSHISASSPTRFLLITAIGMCHFLPVHHLGMACLAGSKVNIQQSKGRATPDFEILSSPDTLGILHAEFISIYWSTESELTVIVLHDIA